MVFQVTVVASEVQPARRRSVRRLAVRLMRRLWIASIRGPQRLFAYGARRIAAQYHRLDRNEVNDDNDVWW